MEVSLLGPKRVAFNILHQCVRIERFSILLFGKSPNLIPGQPERETEKA